MGENKIRYENKVIYKNSILSAGYKIVSAILSLISASLLLNCLGEEKYGVWVTILSLISWIYYCDLGIGNGLRNKLASALAVDNINASKKNLGTAYTLIGFISIIVFLAVLVLLYIFFACTNFIMSLANNVLFAVQKASLVNLFSCLSQLIFVILLGIYAATGINTILFMALGEGIAQLLKNVVETIFVFRKFPELQFSIHDYDKEYTRGILSFGIQMFLVQIAALILNSTDNIVITKLFNASAVTPYNFCYKYFNMIQMMYVALITPLMSAYTAAYTLKDKNWIVKSIKKNIQLFIVFATGSFIAALIFKPFTLVWLQKDLNFDLRLIICTFIYFVLLMYSHIFSTFLTGISCIKETTVATMIGTIINIPVSVFLAKNMEMGVAGVILGSAVSLLVIVIVAPYVAFRELRRIRGVV